MDHRPSRPVVGSIERVVAAHCPIVAQRRVDSMMIALSCQARKDLMLMLLDDSPSTLSIGGHLTMPVSGLAAQNHEPMAVGLWLLRG